MTYLCGQCGRTLQESETRHVRAGLRACVACGGIAREELASPAPSNRPLVVEMALAYAFPFRPSSLVVLAPLALVTAFSGFHFYGLLLFVICHGVILATMFAIIRATTSGDDELSVDAMSAHPGEAAVVIVRYVVLVAVCAAPLVAVWWLGLGAPAYALALLAGYLYFPAGLVAASQEAATILDPLVAWRVILAMPRSYFVAVACITPAALVWLGAPWLAAEVTGGRLAFTLEEALSVFAFAIVARICGILLREEGYG